MKFKEGQVVYVEDEGSLAVVDNPYTDKGNVTLFFYPSLYPAEKRNSSRNNRCGGLLQDQDGFFYFDQVRSSRLKENRGTKATKSWYTQISDVQKWRSHAGYRVLPANSSLIHSVPEDDAAQFLHNIAAAREVVEAIEQKNKTREYENSNLSESLIREARYLETIVSELEK